MSRIGLTRLMATSLLLQCLLALNGSCGRLAMAQGGMTHGYYDSTSCPNVEARARRYYNLESVMHPTLSGALLRLVFHDCAVGGCDASILLDTDPAHGIQSERDSRMNFGITFTDVIDNIKSEFESSCPGVVSCADIVAMAARDAVTQTVIANYINQYANSWRGTSLESEVSGDAGGPDIPILTGRKDSRQARTQVADASLLPATASMDQVLASFASMGLSAMESVAIQGAHTLGVGHCQNFADRVWPQHDPSMSLAFSLLLRTTCPAPFNNFNTLTTMPIDSSNFNFDNNYFNDIKQGRGLFTVDAELARDPRTASYVDMFSQNESLFFEVFSSAFMKLTQHNVLMDNNGGEVRRNCHHVN